MQIPALLDTGCNTSIILRSLLGKLLAHYDIFCRSDDEDEDVELQRKKYSEGSVEIFHRFLTSAISHCIDDMDGKGTDQTSGTSSWTLYCSRTEYYRSMGWTFRRSRSSTGVVQTYLSTTFYFERITPHRYKHLKNTWTCCMKLNSTCTKL